VENVIIVETPAEWIPWWPPL